jgi:aspartyl-tRNA(Asn)/glutamyl-tRNA(Gln) amidotransferase subunit B
VEALGLTPYDAGVLVADLDATALFEGALAAGPALSPKRVANWIIGEYLRLAKGEGGAAATSRVSASQLAALVGMVEAGELSGTNAKEVFARHAGSGRPVAELVVDAGLRQISDESTLRNAVGSVLAANPGAVADVRAGKAQAVGFLTGQVMKQTHGQANAARVQQLLREALDLS